MIAAFLLSLGVVGVILMVLFGWVILPLLGIWALNVLLPYHIPMTIWTWLAVAVLRFVFTSTYSFRKSADDSSVVSRTRFS